MDLDVISIRRYSPGFASITGPGQFWYSLILSTRESSRAPLFHDVCAYLPKHNELYVSSNIVPRANSSQLPIILISRIHLNRDVTGAVQTVDWQKLRSPDNMPMPAGGAPYREGVLYCSQGNTAPDTGGLYYMPQGGRPEPVVTSFFGRDFNSVNSVAVASDGSLWFTDPCHGFERESRGPPQLPCHVYRFDPGSGDLRVVADGLGRPHGIALSPDESTVYVTDTDAVRADASRDLTRAATIYAFDVVKRSGAPFLANKRVFAYALTSIPMGVACDGAGNVWAGCADGVEIWSAGGEILGVMEVPGGVTSIAFGTGGEVFLCAEQRLWMLRLKHGAGADLMSDS
ncbi:smp-30/gluconolaconase/lre-like region-containing protein [Lasiosphaeria ovina]|uniref:Smp-30/gluconolaconase/lre-like region-containing protein n=1 Tax=Lasiosphaeria ovina TaxID=92902 RepID=A0AAE0NCJ5_9PEZI|nr:smp-30/gluconolaconase/lre-like region-containing protein [Lasiosphaeria ovina]